METPDQRQRGVELAVAEEEEEDVFGLFIMEH